MNDYKEIKELIEAGEKATQFLEFAYEEIDCPECDLSITTCYAPAYFIDDSPDFYGAFDKVWPRGAIEPETKEFIERAANARQQIKALYDEVMELRGKLEDK